MIAITFELPPDEAKALAQLVKRLGHDDCKQRASRYDGGEEADAMWQAVMKLQRALAESGSVRTIDRLRNAMADQRPRITNVYSFANGMVMVFDQHGQQMPDFQGPAKEAIPKIRAAGFQGPIEERVWP